MKDDHPLKIRARLDWEQRMLKTEKKRAQQTEYQRKRRNDAAAGRATRVAA